MKTLKASSRRPDERLHDEEDRGPKDADLPGRDWPRARPLDAAVEIAIDDVVPRAAGAAHGEGADEKQGEVREARRRAMRGDRSKRRRPPARQQQQPGADRAVKARKAQIGTGPGRRDRIDPVASRVGDRTGRPAHFASGLPLSVSKPCRGQFSCSPPSQLTVPMASLSDGGRVSWPEPQCRPRSGTSRFFRGSLSPAGPLDRARRTRSCWRRGISPRPLRRS